MNNATHRVGETAVANLICRGRSYPDLSNPFDVLRSLGLPVLSMNEYPLASRSFVFIDISLYRVSRKAQYIIYSRETSARYRDSISIRVVAVNSKNDISILQDENKKTYDTPSLYSDKFTF